MSESRTIIITGDREPLPVVFEMRGPTIDVHPGETLRLVLTGPEDAELTIGCGRQGVSVYRDPELTVEAFGPDGARIDTTGFA